jgi:hypothetical protein
MTKEQAQAIKEEIKEADEVNTRHFSRIFNAYKTLWWNRKEFK